MRYATTTLGILRFSVGVYLILTAMARVLAPPESSTLLSLYSMLGLAPLDQALVRTGVSLVLAVLGLWLLIGRLLVVGGLLVAALGLVNALSELVVSQTRADLLAAERMALLNMGLRDLLILVPVGIAIALMDAHVRRLRRQEPTVTMYPEGAQKAARR